MALRGAILGDNHLSEPGLVSRDVLGQQLRQELEMIRAHAHARVDADQSRFLGRPLAEVEDEAQRVAVDEHCVGVNDLGRAVLDLDLDRQLAHSSTTSTWPSFTTSVSLTRISDTLPARGAVTGISIFMDSRIMSTSSSATWSPGLAVIFHTLPTSSALTSVNSSSRHGRALELVVDPAPGQGACEPRPATQPRNRARGKDGPPSRPAHHCSSPSVPPRDRSCPPDQLARCLPA